MTDKTTDAQANAMRGHSLLNQLRDKGFRISAMTALPDSTNATVIYLALDRPDNPTVHAVLVERENWGYTLYVETPYLTIAEDIEHVERSAAYYRSELPAPVGRGT